MLFKVRYDDPLDPMNATVDDLSAPAGSANPLPNTGVGSEAVALERGSNGGIYIGTDLGVFYTNNEFLANGTGWQLLGPNLPHVTCRGLEISYKANKLRAGTEGRGVWEHDLWCPDDEDLVENGTYASDAFREAINDVSSTAIVASGRDVSYRGGNAVRLQPGFHAAQGSAFHAFIHPCDRAGNSFKSMPGDGASPPPESSTPAISRSAELVVHPNPNQGAFTVKLPEGASAVEAVRLLNAQGRMVPISLGPASSPLVVSLGHHPSGGMYLLQVLLTDGTVHHAKFILQP